MSVSFFCGRRLKDGLKGSSHIDTYPIKSCRIVAGLSAIVGGAVEVTNGYNYASTPPHKIIPITTWIFST